MMRRAAITAAIASALVTLPLAAQENALVQGARQAYENLDYAGAIAGARRALTQRLSAADQINAYEVLAYSYGALDSARQAVDAFRELIFLDPNREPDVNRVSPRITSLYASALGQVLVVRRVRMDSTSFVSGRGAAALRYEVSRPARVIARVSGPGVSMVLDSQLVAGTGGLQWQALDSAGAPLPAGNYQLVVTAIEGSNQFATPLPVTVVHSAVDTLPHLTSLPGYSPLPEFETPPRNWRPFGVALLATGLGAGASIALENPDLEAGSRREVLSVGAAVLVTGLAMSLKKPDPRPVQANILYNQLLREQLAQRNAEIVAENAQRRRQVRVTVMETGGPGGGQ